MIQDAIGAFHPALVHFPIALITTGMALESIGIVKKMPVPSSTARLLLVFGLLGAVASVISGLLHFDPEHFQGRTLEAAGMHRLFGLTALAAAALTLAVGASGSIRGYRLWIYRALYGLSATAVGLAGHYGGWLVFGRGAIWTF